MQLNINLGTDSSNWVFYYFPDTVALNLLFGLFIIEGIVK